MNIVFIGMKHCGKSTSARNVSEKFNIPFLDTDDLMAELYFDKFQEKKTAKQIFAKHGKEFFMELEAETVLRLAKRLDTAKNQVVLGLGGATPTNGDIVGELKKHNCFVVYLKTNPETIFTRVVRNGPSRFLNSENPLADFIKVSEEREPFYLKYADAIVDTSELKSVNKMIEAVIEVVKDHLNP